MHHIFVLFGFSDEKNNSILGLCKRLQLGLSKIDEASTQIEILRKEVVEQQAEVVIASKRCEEMLEEIRRCKQFFFHSHIVLV